MSGYFTFSLRPFVDCVSSLRTNYNLTQKEAELVWCVGDNPNQTLIVNGIKFFSGHRDRNFDSEYYIPIYGPNGLEFSRYHCNE